MLTHQALLDQCGIWTLFIEGICLYHTIWIFDTHGQHSKAYMPIWRTSSTTNARTNNVIISRPPVVQRISGVVLYNLPRHSDTLQSAARCDVFWQLKHTPTRRTQSHRSCTLRFTKSGSFEYHAGNDTICNQRQIHWLQRFSFAEHLFFYPCELRRSWL